MQKSTCENHRLPLFAGFPSGLARCLLPALILALTALRLKEVLSSFRAAQSGCFLRLESLLLNRALNLYQWLEAFQHGCLARYSNDWFHFFKETIFNLSAQLLQSPKIFHP
jgi:hypothetical protein